MSGPIVRKYGFPNFDQIFGKRELEHGVDDQDEAPTEEAKKPAEPAAKADAPKAKAKAKKKK
jgi:hypothetical protein